MRWLQQERHKQLGASTDNNFAAPATTNFTVRHNYARAKQPTAHIAFRLKSVRSRSIPRLMMIRWIFWRMSPSLVRLRGPPRLRVQRKIWSFRTPFGQEFEHFFCSFLYRVRQRHPEKEAQKMGIKLSVQTSLFWGAFALEPDSNQNKKAKKTGTHSA